MDKKEYLEFIECEVYKNSHSIIKRIYNKYFNPVTNSVYLFRKMTYLHLQKGWISKIRVFMLQRKLAWRYGIFASPDTVIGKGLRFVHPTSIVIGTHVVAGENLTLYQNTTIGGLRTGDVNLGNQPHIGDNVTLFANSLVLGKIEIGNNVIVGANSLVLTSIPDNSVCVGAPAKIIKTKKEETEAR